MGRNSGVKRPSVKHPEPYRAKWRGAYAKKASIIATRNAQGDDDEDEA